MQSYEEYMASRQAAAATAALAPAETSFIALAPPAQPVATSDLDIAEIEVSELGYLLCPPGAAIIGDALSEKATKVAEGLLVRVAQAAGYGYVSFLTNAAAGTAATAVASAGQAAAVTAVPAAIAAAEVAAGTATAAAATAATAATTSAASTAATAALAAAATAATVAAAPAITAAAGAVATAAAAGAVVAGTVGAALAPATAAATAASVALAPAATAAAAAASGAAAAASGAAAAAGPVVTAATAAAAATAATAATVSTTALGAEEAVAAQKAVAASLRPGSFVGDAWVALTDEVGAIAGKKKPLALPGALGGVGGGGAETVVTQGVYVSPVSGAPLFCLANAAGAGPEGLHAFAVPPMGSRMLQHVRTVTQSPASSATMPRTELIDATSGAKLGLALGMPPPPAAAALPSAAAGEGEAAAAMGTLQASDAQLLLVDEPAVLLVPRGERPPAEAPLPAAPAIRRLLERAPEWMGSAYVVTLAGGPFWGLGATLAAVPGVLEAVVGYTGRAAPPQGTGALPHEAPTFAEIAAGGSGLVEAVQLAVDPAVDLEVVLDAFWAAHDPASERGGGGGASHASAIFYHSANQRDAALASRSWLERTSGLERVATSIRPATAFWEPEPEPDLQF